MITTVIGFIIGLVLLLKGADYFVGGGSGLAARFRVSPTLIGFTVIAFGTSMPEFVVNINAALLNTPDIALGNVLGSNIANIALVLALCAIINPRVIRQEQPAGNGGGISELNLMLGVTVVFALLALRMQIDLLAGIILLACFVLVMWLLWKNLQAEETPIKSHGWRDYVETIGGLAGVIVGANLLVNSSTEIATLLGISPFVIGMTMVAVGTSLPELATSLVAVARGQGGLSVGNVLGSNIFNLLFVMGAAALIIPIPVASYTDIIVVLLFSFATLPFFVKNVSIRRYWGVIILAAYAAYMLYLFGLF
jgi:cation:H+ antiporter